MNPPISARSPVTILMLRPGIHGPNWSRYFCTYITLSDCRHNHRDLRDIRAPTRSTKCQVRYPEWKELCLSKYATNGSSRIFINSFTSRRPTVLRVQTIQDDGTMLLQNAGNQQQVTRPESQRRKTLFKTRCSLFNPECIMRDNWTTANNELVRTRKGAVVA